LTDIVAPIWDQNNATVLPASAFLNSPPRLVLQP
jgi:hypothetical protein